MKNETKTNKKGDKPIDVKLKDLFEAVKRLHAKMILNPFFTCNTYKSNGRGGYFNPLDDDLSSRESFEKKDRPPVKFWSTKAVNKQCLKDLQNAIDKKVLSSDRDMRENY